MNIETAFHQFLFDKTVENLAVSTMQNYTFIIGAFVRFVGLDADIASLSDGSIVKTYIVYLQGKKLAGKSIHTYVKHIKVFYGWLFGEENAIRSFRVRYEKSLPRVLDLDEIKSLMCLGSLRDRLLVCLVLDCGLRKNELAHLKVADIGKNCLYVRLGKGRKDRVVPLSPNMRSMIDLYLVERLGDTPELFQTIKGLPLTYTAIRCVFRRLKDKTGIERLTPHLLRHTYGTYYIVNGGDIKMLQLLLGHSEVKTTETYIHLAEMMDVGKCAKYSIFNVLSNEKDSLP